MGTSTVSTVTALVQLAPATPQWVAIVAGVRDWLLVAVAAFGGYVAWRGLWTWRDQLAGRYDYELAKRLLRLLYEYRDGIAAMRNPFFTVDLPVESDLEPGDPEWQAASHTGMQRDYDERWQKVRAARASLYPELLEAEVLWGPGLNQLLSPLFDLEYRLHEATITNLEYNRPGAQKPDPMDPFYDLVYGDPVGDLSSPTDAYAVEFTTVLTPVVGELSRRLRPGRA